MRLKENIVMRHVQVPDLHGNDLSKRLVDVFEVYENENADYKGEVELKGVTDSLGWAVCGGPIAYYIGGNFLCWESQRQKEMRDNIFDNFKGIVAYKQYNIAHSVLNCEFSIIK